MGCREGICIGCWHATVRMVSKRSIRSRGVRRHLEHEGLPVPSNATIHRILTTPGRLPDRYRLRYDRVDTDGHISIRRAGRMHHLGIGRRHTGTRILAITDETTVTVIHLHTGEILSEHTIDPDHGYWRNTLNPPGRRPHT